MMYLFATMATLMSNAHDSLNSRTKALKGERGSVSLEQVIITLGLLLLAIALIAAVTGAFNDRLGRIN